MGLNKHSPTSLRTSIHPPPHQTSFFANLVTHLFINFGHSANSAVRTYPASAGTVLLPLTPANGYTATILFCGGQNISDWSASSSLVNHAASPSCVSITPDISTAWTEESSLPDGRTMGNMILLPDGKICLLSGAAVGTAGYGGDSFSFGDSYATNPLHTPV